jgi:hypothetical protein
VRTLPVRRLRTRPRLGLGERQDDSGEGRVEDDRSPAHPQNVDLARHSGVLLADDVEIVLPADREMVSAQDVRVGAAALRFRPPQGIPQLKEELMDISRRTAGLGLLAYGVGTPVAFMTINAPGGDYDENMIATYISSDHRVTAIALAYLGAFAALGLLPFAARMRSELRSGGDVFWGLSVAGVAASVVGWFMLGGIQVVFAEGGTALAGLPHDVVYALSEVSILVAVCASSFLVGAAALVLAARGPLLGALRAFTVVGGVAGLVAAFFFPVFLFWLWAIVLGARTLASGTRSSTPVRAQHQPV